MTWWWLAEGTTHIATPDPEPPPPDPDPSPGGALAETLSKIRQRVGWMIARAENATAEFTGEEPLKADILAGAPSALQHGHRAYDELTAWIDAGVNDLNDVIGGT